jgi:hypothetical protein
MSGLAGDIKLQRVSVPGNAHQPLSMGVGAGVQIYSGDVALKSAGTGATAGYLKSTTTPVAADVVMGMVGDPAGGTYVKTGPGILGGTNDGDVRVTVETGSFRFQNGTGADTIAVADVGATCYFQGSNTNGPIAAKTNGSNSRPVLGTILPFDPTTPSGFVDVELTPVGGP